MLRAVIVLSFAACGSKTAPPPARPEPVLDDQALCQRVAERTVDRFVTAAVARWEYPELARPEPARVLADQRAMFVTVVFDSCFAEWPEPARSCFLSAAADAPIESCRLGEELLGKAIGRARTLLYSLAT